MTADTERDRIVRHLGWLATQAKSREVQVALSYAMATVIRGDASLKQTQSQPELPRDLFHPTTTAALIEREHRALIWNIAARAVGLGIFKITMHGVALVMITHRHCPLRLADLLAAEDHDFVHDIVGIAKHIDWDTGKLGGAFLPRFRSV